MRVVTRLTAPKKGRPHMGRLRSKALAPAKRKRAWKERLEDSRSRPACHLPCPGVSPFRQQTVGVGCRRSGRRSRVRRRRRTSRCESGWLGRPCQWRGQVEEGFPSHPSRPSLKPKAPPPLLLRLLDGRPSGFLELRLGRRPRVLLGEFGAVEALDRAVITRAHPAMLRGVETNREFVLAVLGGE